MSSSLPTTFPSSPSRSRRARDRRKPSVTPKRFTRFFRPRSALAARERVALDALTAPAINRRPRSPPSPDSASLDEDSICPSSPTEGLGSNENARYKRRRRLYTASDPAEERQGVTPDGVHLPALRLPRRSPPASRGQVSDTTVALVEARVDGDVLGRRRNTLRQFFSPRCHHGLASPAEKLVLPASAPQSLELRTNLNLADYRPKPIRNARHVRFEVQTLEREFGTAALARDHILRFPVGDARSETAGFYSDAHDVHQCSAPQGEEGMAIPFSLSSCHRADYTAIGADDGHVRLFNTTEDARGPFRFKVDAYIKVVDNAIIDMDISQDDLRLAAACGDQSGRIVDVRTQTVAVDLTEGHWESLRKIAFQPASGNGDILATSDRAGRVQMWDLRCAPLPVNMFSTVSVDRDTRLEPVRARTINTIRDAHQRVGPGSRSSVSVTAIQWLPQGREHLLLTASDANACVKLWDTRYIRPRRHVRDTPLATTKQPTAHAWRPYGITSLALSGDASLLYAVCKDSTIYAHSMNHLMLGYAPELGDGAAKRKPVDAQGLRPMYGLKHENFVASTFYVKCALRPASHGYSELLAVGSQDSCAVLFPTCERYLRSSQTRRAFGANEEVDGVPIFHAGTALIRGHSREVTTVSWSHDGKLVTASDDYGVRQWQTDAARARHLRRVGEFGGERYMAGWADVGEDWDLDDDDTTGPTLPLVQT